MGIDRRRAREQLCHNSESMRTTIAVLLACACLACPGWCEHSTDIKKDLERIAAEAGGRVGVSAVLVESGEHIALHGDMAFFMASVVKFPVALTVLHLVDTGKLRLDQKVRLLRSDPSPGVSVLGGKFKPGSDITVRQLLDYMITASDNTACDVLLRISGGTPAVMARLQALGIRGIRVDRSEKQNAAAYRRSARRFMTDPRDRSTPDAMAALLAKFQQGETLTPASTSLLRNLMEHTTTFTRMQTLLPPNTVVAHKTGTWDKAAINDVGIITLPGGAKHVAVAIFTSGSRKKQAEVEHAIAEMTRAVYNYWQ